MKNLTRLIVAILSLQVAFGSVSSARATEKTITRPEIAYRVALLSLRDMIAKNPDAYLDPSDTQSDAALADKVTMLEANQALIKKLKDNSYTMENIRGDLIERLNTEEAAQRLEIRNILQKMDDKDVETLAKTSFDKGHYSPTLKVQYETSYLMNEKKEVLFDLLVADLANAKSDALKRLGLMNREILEKELSGTKTLLNMKGDGWKIALIVILSVAAAGLISFGVVSATKARHERKLRELEDEYKKKTADEIAASEAAIAELRRKHQQNLDNTNAEWLRKTQELEKLFADRAALRDGGYTWQICKVQNTPKTVTCPYDNKTYVGQETCSSYCLKNPAGLEFGVQQLICSSAQIPWECFKPNAYGSGYSNGGTAGYNDGYNYGYDVNYTAAYNHAYQNYYEIAYNRGYSYGYQYGYDDGYSDGLSDGQYNGYSDGYADGYPIGYAEGYAYGQQVAAGG